jgi:predicted ATPase
MLQRIRLTDFKSFVDEEVGLSPLTLLVGANASGKSNFLDAIRFLQGLSRNLTLSEVLNGEESNGSDRWPGIRGRAEEAARIGMDSFSFESTWLSPAVVEQPDRIVAGAPRSQEIKHRLVCRPLPQAIVHEEKLSWRNSSEKRLSAQPDPEGLRVQLSDGRFRSVSDKKSLVTDPMTRLSLSISGREDFEVLESLHQALLEVRFLEIQPARMRDYGRRGAPLGSEGKNFSGALATLCDDPATKHSLVDWLREVCAPEVADLDFAEVKELGDVMAIFREEGGARISARSISDGTLRFLGTLLALRTAQRGEVVLIEEIEEGLHPTRIHLLVELLESVVRERGIQVIASTHSPVVLQWLSPEALRDVIVFGRVPDREGTLMQRLGDLPHVDEVVWSKGIEELFTTGWLEMAL